MNKLQIFRFKIIFIFLIIMIGSSSGLICQSAKLFKNEVFAIHPKIGALYTFYSGDFRTFDGIVDCGNLKTGSGLGLGAALFGEYPINKKFQIGFGLGYSNRSGELSNERYFQTRDTTTIPSKIVDVTTDNVVEATLHYFDIMPEIRYVLFDNLIKGPARLALGFNFSIPVKSTVKQTEKVVSPSNMVFIVDGKRTKERLLADGDINTINNLIYGINLGFENLLKVGKKTCFTQQISFNYYFKDIVSDAEWKNFGVRLDLGLRFSLTKEPPVIQIVPPPPPPHRDTTKEEIVKNPQLNVKIDTLLGTIYTGEELLATLPLVNAVFFDINSSDIPEKYIKRRAKLPNLYTGDAINIHRFVLLRIAEIMNKNPKATITLEAATSGKEREPQGLKLAEQRSEAVRDALIGLGVPENKIKTKQSIFPKYQSNQEFELGAVENQRVDIIVHNAPLQEYVALQKYAELDADYELNFNYQDLESASQVKISHYLIDSVYDFNNNIPMRVQPKEYNVGLNNKYKFGIKMRIGSISEPYKIHISAETNGLRADDSKYFNLNLLPQKTVENNLDNFEALLRFDYNSSKLSDDNQGLLKQLSEFLPAGSTIIIYGSADALGTDQRNAVLANERASETEKFIRKVSGDKLKIETSTDAKKLPETTQEGRFLNRSIRIKVKSK